MEQNSYYIFYLTDMRNRNILIANKIIKHRGAGTNRLRLRLDVSLTLIPDLDNASVGTPHIRIYVEAKASLDLSDVVFL